MFHNFFFQLGKKLRHASLEHLGPKRSDFVFNAHTLMLRNFMYALNHQKIMEVTAIYVFTMHDKYARKLREQVTREFC